MGLGSWSPGVHPSVVCAMGPAMLVLEGMLVPTGSILVPAGHSWAGRGEAWGEPIVATKGGSRAIGSPRTSPFPAKSRARGHVQLNQAPLIFSQSPTHTKTCLKTGNNAKKRLFPEPGRCHP